MDSIRFNSAFPACWAMKWFRLNSGREALRLDISFLYLQGFDSVILTCLVILLFVFRLQFFQVGNQIFYLLLSFYLIITSANIDGTVLHLSLADH